MINSEIYPGLVLPQVDRLKEIINEVFDIKEFLVANRKEPEVVARMIFMSTLRYEAKLHPELIAELVGCTRPNVLNAIKKIDITYRKDVKYGPQVRECERLAKKMFEDGN